MKKTFKNITKLGILLFGISLGITSCQKDDAVVSETPVEQHGFTLTKITPTIINNDLDLVTVLERITPKKTKSSNSERAYYNEAYGFEIDTEEGVLIEDNITGLKHYTFAILNNDIDAPLQNVIIKENLDGTYSSFITEYNFTERDYYTNENIDKSNVKYFPINIDANSILNESNNSTNRCIAPHYECLEVWVTTTTTEQIYPDCPNNEDGPHEHQNGYVCQDTTVTIYTDVLLGSDCSWTAASGCGGETTTTGTTSGTSGSSGGSDAPDDGLPTLGDTIVTTPVLTSAEIRGIYNPFINEILPPLVKECIELKPNSADIFAAVKTFLTTIPDGMTYEEYTNDSPQLQANNAFANEALASICEGGEVDYVDVIVLDETFKNNQKLKCVYDKLKGLSSTVFNDIINDHFDSSKNSKITFSVDNITTGEDAQTRQNTTSSGVAFYDIVIDTDFANNASALEIALTLIHESIHAELLDRCFQLGLINSASYNPTTGQAMVIFNSSPTVFSTESAIYNQLLIEYNAYPPSSSGDWNHDLFNVLHYRTKIIQNLMNIHPWLNDTANDFLNNVNNDPFIIGGPYTLEQLLNYISWIGLEDTQEYNSTIINNILETSKKVYIQGAARSEYTHDCN